MPDSTWLILRSPFCPSSLRPSENRRISRLFCFLGLTQTAKTLHVLANINRLSFQIRHRSCPFFQGQTLLICARESLPRRFSRLLAGHPSSELSTSRARSIPGSSGPNGHFSTSVKWRKHVRQATDFPRLPYHASCRS